MGTSRGTAPRHAYGSRIAIAACARDGGALGAFASHVAGALGREGDGGLEASMGGIASAISDGGVDAIRRAIRGGRRRKSPLERALPDEVRDVSMRIVPAGEGGWPAGRQVAILELTQVGSPACGPWWAASALVAACAGAARAGITGIEWAVDGRPPSCAGGLICWRSLASPLGYDSDMYVRQARQGEDHWLADRMCRLASRR